MLILDSKSFIDPVKENAGHERLCDKINSAHSKTITLCNGVCVCRKEYYGYLSCLGILPDMTHYFKAVHERHLNIKEYKIRSIIFEEMQSLRSRNGRSDLAEPFKNCSGTGQINIVIINNQDVFH